MVQLAFERHQQLDGGGDRRVEFQNAGLIFYELILIVAEILFSRYFWNKFDLCDLFGSFI
jgi:hypothetical protein